MEMRRPSRKKTRPKTAAMRPAASRAGVGLVFWKKMAIEITCWREKKQGGKGEVLCMRDRCIEGLGVAIIDQTEGQTRKSKRPRGRG